MPSKDFENFELRLKTLREESQEVYEVADVLFSERFENHLEDIFPRDVLGAKKYIRWIFIIRYSDRSLEWEEPDNSEIFREAVEKTIKTLPLSSEKKNSLAEHITSLSQSSETLEKYFRRNDDLSRDPFFALVEDFSMDGEISREEFLLLSENYTKSWNFLCALEWLPETTRKMFEWHIRTAFGKDLGARMEELQGEYTPELQKLSQKWLNIAPVVKFIARSYYKSPGKLRKYESPKRRMRRTMKMSLLRLLRLKLWNIDAEIALQKFESGESFEDFFMLLYRLMEVVDENPSGKEAYSLLDTVEETEEEVISAEETKKKILEWEELTASISGLMGKLDGEIEGELMERLLDDDTHFHGDDIHFQHGKEMAGIYAETENEDIKEEDEDDFIDSWDTLEGNYERLKHAFSEVDEKKRKAFLEWDYDIIDICNDELIAIESKITKISKLLGKEV